MRSDVLEVISSARDVTNAVVLTHNIDFIFVQTVVMSAFRRCGHPTITIFADSGCAAETFAQQRAVLTDLGARYRVVPIAMGTRFRFHPKAVLLTGETRGSLLVGSGNLTFGGWRENAEVWTRFENESDGSGPFHAFRGYLADVLKQVVLPEAVKREVDEAFDPTTKPWLSTGAADDALVGRVGSGPPLLEQMLAVGGGEPVEELLVCAPYFDNDGAALQELVASVGAHRTTVLCQPDRTGLHARAWKPNAPTATLQSIDYRHRGVAESERSAFVHAKFYGLRRDDNVLVLAGSANCSSAALTVRGNASNAELMAVRLLTPQAFEDEFLGELERSSEPVALADGPPDEDDADFGATPLRVLAARFDVGRLQVGYAPSSATVVECFVDEATVPFEPAENGVVGVSCASEPQTVALRARLVDGVEVESEVAWVDLERKLCATAHSRSLADSFRARVQAGAWSADGWAEVLDVFCKHLVHMPPVVPGGTAQPADDRDDGSDGPTYTEADVFAPEYRPPKLDRVWFPAGDGGHGQVHSLQQLLLRWFGVAGYEPETESEVDDSDGPEGEEVVDQPERLPTAPPTERPQTVLNKRRIARIVDQLEGAMTSSQFLEGRSPDYLATDLKVASALLGVGLGKGWMERDRFFELTHSIWSSLFFARRGTGREGWLEYRASSSEDREAFIRSMRSADLSAALLGWYLAVRSPGSGSPEAARFLLAAALAVARLPWLWHGGSDDDIRRELAVLLAHTAGRGADNEERNSWAEAEWARLAQRGQALRRFEAVIRNTSLEILRERIRIDELGPGDVLWQGKAGFSVVLRRCSRSGTDYVSALKLEGDGGETAFVASATVPVRALLGEEVIPRTPGFGHGPREVLREFVRELSKDALERD